MGHGSRSYPRILLCAAIRLKWRVFVREMHIFMNCGPKMRESGYTNRDKFGRSA